MGLALEVELTEVGVERTVLLHQDNDVIDVRYPPGRSGVRRRVPLRAARICARKRAGPDDQRDHDEQRRAETHHIAAVRSTHFATSLSRSTSDVTRVQINHVLRRPYATTPQSVHEHRVSVRWPAPD